jgi:hypothetical protein
MIWFGRGATGSPDAVSFEDETAPTESFLDSFPGLTRLNSWSVAPLSQATALYNGDDSYLASPAYFMLTGRRGLWRAGETARPMLLALHPNREKRLLVFLPGGTVDVAGLMALLPCIQRHRFSMDFCRIEESDGQLLREVLLESVGQNDCCVRLEAESDLDWAYPIHVINTHAVAGLAGPLLCRIRQRMRKVERAISSLEVQPLATGIRAAAEFVSDLARENVMRSKLDFYSPYDYLFRLSLNPAARLQGMLVSANARPVALAIWDQPANRDSANCLCNLASRTVPGMSEWLIHALCVYLAGSGIPYLNLGGSETAELDRFKRKFAPAVSLPRMTLKIRPSPAAGC